MDLIALLCVSLIPLLGILHMFMDNLDCVVRAGEHDGTVCFSETASSLTTPRFFLADGHSRSQTMIDVISLMSLVKMKVATHISPVK